MKCYPPPQIWLPERNIIGTSGPDDPYWANVIFLLNGTGAATKDSGPSNRALQQFAPGIALDGPQLFGVNAYTNGAAGAGKLQFNAPGGDVWLSPLLTNQEWCLEGFIQKRAISTGQDNIFSFNHFTGYLSDNGAIRFNCDNMGQSSITVGSAAGAVNVGDAPIHFAWCRDKSDATWDYLKLYLGGQLVGSSGAQSKSAVIGVYAWPTPSYDTGFNYLVGYNDLSPRFSLWQFRFTGGAPGCARYRANFVPPSAPFPYA